MRRLLLLACCALLATIIAYFALGRGARAPTPLEQRVPDVARDSATSESVTERLDSALDGSLEAQPALRARAGEARLVGRVVDESRRALAQASIRVFALDVGPPKRGADAERRRQAGRAHAVVATSASDGSFELIASSIAGRLLRLEVETQDHRGAFAQDLSDEFEPSRSQIHEGDNDLGDLVVRFDGAILGSVHLNDGVAVRGATVELRAQGRCIVSSTSREDGTFALACVPSGTYLLEAVEPEAGRACQREIALAPRECIDDLELVIERASAVTGVVVDDDGAPVSTQLVRACKTAARGVERDIAQTWTAPDGSFKLIPDGKQPFFLRCGGGEFADWSSLRTGEPNFRPGAAGIRIQLSRHPTCVVTVLDERTQLPLEFYGIAELPDDDEAVGPPGGERDEVGNPIPGSTGQGGLRLPTLVRHPKGQATLALRSSRQRHVAWARGHEPRVQALGSQPEQALVLSRSNSVRGRLTRGGAPIAAERVVMRPLDVVATAARPAAGAGRDAEPLADEQAQQRFVNQRSSWFASALTAGGFEFTELESGRWELLVAEEHGSPPRCLVPELTLRSGDERDLGELDFPAASAALWLRVLVDDPIRVADMTELLQLRLNGAELKLEDGALDESGWHQTGLVPGDLEARVGSTIPFIGELGTAHVTLVDGEQRTLEIDMRGQPLCRIEIAVEAGPAVERVEIFVSAEGQPRAGLQAVWVPADPRPVVFVVRGGQRVTIGTSVKRNAANAKRASKIPDTTLELPLRGSVRTTVRIP